ncbi:MAG: AmmeMemoRadiSam system protein B [Rhizobiaceae bacterium]
MTRGALVAVILLALCRAAMAAPGCPPDDANFASLYDDPALFENGIQAVADYPPSAERLTGIVVPHHLTAAHLVALGFRAASAHAYRRIVILAPDHFRGSTKPFAATSRGFDTPFGPVAADAVAVSRLSAALPDLEESCLFWREHGVQALLPFLKRTFPEAGIVPVAISIGADRADWDRLVEALAAIVDDETLVVESTDFSHYLPHHEARRRDQQTLNVIASGSLDALTVLEQPAHLDSLGALYVQARLQRERFGAEMLPVASENQQQYDERAIAETTSYMVLIYGRFGPGAAAPAPYRGDTVYFAGDTNFGRAMKHVLIRDGAEERVLGTVRSLTGGRPLVVNLEGVILPNVPEAIDDMTLAMPEDLTIDWLGKLGVAAVSLANNHALDLGASGYAETTRALDAAGIPHFGQGEALALGGIDIVGLSDLDTNAARQVDLLTSEHLDALVRPDPARPVIAFVHWGREYAASPSERELMLADGMRLRGPAAIVGAHPHVASQGLSALAGGDAVMAYSVGNFLFDQGAARASGAMVELRVFPQGTVFARPVPLPNLFDLARE